MQKGRGWHGDAEGHSKAGRKGGRMTSQKHGLAFYKKIGRLGGTNRAKNERKRTKNSNVAK